MCVHVIVFMPSLSIFIAFTTWLSFGGLINRPYVYSYPVTTAGCNITDENLLANISSPVYDPSTWNPQSHYRYNIYIVFSFNNGMHSYICIISYYMFKFYVSNYIWNI